MKERQVSSIYKQWRNQERTLAQIEDKNEESKCNLKGQQTGQCVLLL